MSERTLHRSLWAVALLCLPLLAQASDQGAERALVAEDFAHGRSLELIGIRALQSALLDGAVYRGTVESELADLRVFNADREAVPHAIRRLESRNGEDRLSAPLPLFRLHRNRAGSEMAEGGFRIEADLSAGSASFRMEPVGPGTPSADRDGDELIGYLVDTEGLDEHVIGLELELASVERDFITSVRVDGSPNLMDYQERSGGSAIARLEQSGHQVLRTRIHLKRNRDRYLKLAWGDADLPAAIRSIRAYTSPLRIPVPLMRETLRAESGLDLPEGVFVYDLGSELPVRQLQLELSRRNSLVEARLESSHSLDGPWRHHHAGLFYDLDYAGRLRNEPVRMGSRHSLPRYVKVTVAAKGGGREGAPPRLAVAWQPEQLLFVASGPAPYTLAYGRAKTAPTRFDFGKLLAVTQTREKELPLETAELGPERVLAGPSVLEPPPEPVSPRTVALWSVLALAVAAVAIMSLRLLREMKKDEGNGTAEV